MSDEHSIGCPCLRCKDEGLVPYHRGAAVAFGLMGMAWAIRGRDAYNPDCIRCVALSLEHDPECGWA